MAGPWEKYATAQAPTAAGPWAKYATAPTEEKPSPLGTDGQNYAAGIGKFASDTGTGIAKTAADMLATAPNSLPLLKAIGAGLNKAGASPKAVSEDLSQQILETRRRDAPLMDTKAGQAGYLTGGVMTAPVLPSATTARGAATVAGGVGATQPAVNGRERAINTVTSAAAGFLGQAGMNRLSAFISPKVSPQVKALMDEGVTPTPGQILGGGYKRAEEGLTSIPVIGDSIKAGQNRAIADMNTAAFNRVLAPVKEKLPEGLKGREAVEYVGETLSKKYEELLPKMTTRMDEVFVTQLDDLRTMVKSGNLGEAEAAQFEKILSNKVLSKFGGLDAVTGQTLKGIESDLNRIASGYRRDTSFDKQQLGDALTEVQSALRELISRSNPQYAKELKAANEGWANFKRVQRAASSVAAEDGVFTPAQLLNATKALDRSKDKARFAEGGALMQDLAESGKTTLGPKLHDSGTPFRSMAALAATGGAGALANLTPAGWAMTGAGLVAAPVMYSKSGQNALATLLTKRPESAPLVANRLLQFGAPLSLSVAPGVSYGSRE